MLFTAWTEKNLSQNKVFTIQLQRFCNMPRTTLRMASLCTATNKELVIFLFWTQHRQFTYQNDWISGETDWHHHHQQFLFKYEENNENHMAAHAFLVVFYSSRRPIQIGPTADFNGAAKVPILKECHFGKMKLWRVEHFHNIFVFTFGCDCWVQ